MQYAPLRSTPRVWSATSGFLLVEVILASTLFVLLATMFIGSYLYGQEATAVAGARARASLLADEGIEAVRNMRDERFTNLTNGTFGLGVSGGQWVFSGTQDVTDVFTRQVVVPQISPNEKNVAVTVSWQQTPSRTGTVSRSARLTHWAASWATPFQEDSTNISGAQDGLKIQVQGNYVYLVRNVSGAANFFVFDITDPANPVQLNALTVAGTPSDIAVAGQYAYVTSSDNSVEMRIINISNPSTPSFAGAYNDAGNEDARAVFVSGTSAYLAMNSGNDFVIVNVANPAAPAFTSGLVLSGSAFDVVVLGTRAYVASDTDTQELQAVNIASNPPVLVGSLNLSGTDNGNSITGFWSTVILGRSGAGGVHTINVTNPAPSLLGSTATGGVVNNLALGNSNRYVFAATSAGTAEFQVFDINVPATPSLAGSLDLPSVVNGIAYDSTYLRAYLASASDTQELQVLMPL